MISSKLAPLGSIIGKNRDGSGFRHGWIRISDLDISPVGFILTVPCVPGAVMLHVWPKVLFMN